VVKHADTDPCGNPLPAGALSGVRGVTSGVQGLALGQNNTQSAAAVPAAAPLGSDRISQSSVGSTQRDSAIGGGVGVTNEPDMLATGANTRSGATTGATTTGTSTHTAGHQEPGGIKGMINKVIPGPGPFKA
jgi:hypothetical protein